MVDRRPAGKMVGSGQHGPALFLLNSLVIGGSERRTVKVVNELSRGGLDVHLAYLNAPHTQREQVDAGVPVVCLGRRGKISVGAIRALTSYVERWSVSKAICVNLYPLIYAMAARALLPPQRRPAVVLQVNTTEHVHWKDRLAMTVYGPLMRRADKIVFGCRAQLDLWMQRYALDEDRCEVIYNGVDETRFSAAAAPIEAIAESRTGALRGKDFVIGAIGQLRPGKNHVELIEAFALIKDLFPRARVVIVGEGEERPRLEALVRANGLEERVQLLGQLDDVRPILQSLDVFALPSISETFSNAVLEAMAMSKVVVLSDTGGAREMVRDGVSGYVYPRGDPAALAAILARLAQDAATRKAMGAMARAAVEERFSAARMVDEYRRLVAG